jgi:hypothetical protein
MHKTLKFVCKACLGNALKQLSINCLYLVNVVPFKIK